MPAKQEHVRVPGSANAQSNRWEQSTNQDEDCTLLRDTLPLRTHSSLLLHTFITHGVVSFGGMTRHTL